VSVGARLRVAGRPCYGYLFCDAGLPEDGASRLDLLAVEDPGMAEGFRAALIGSLRPGGGRPRA
jgi:hypothetical protein